MGSDEAGQGRGEASESGGRRKAKSDRSGSGNVLRSTVGQFSWSAEQATSSPFLLIMVKKIENIFYN